MADGLFLLPRGPVGLIGDALMARLKLPFTPDKFDHQFVPAKLDGATWSKLLRRPPFVGVGFAEIEQAQQGGSQFTGAARWVVFLVTKNERGPYERFFGDKFAPGVLQMMEAAVAALQGFQLTAGTTKLGTIGIHAAQNSYAEDWKDEALAMVQLSLSVFNVGITVPDILGGADTVPTSIDGTTITWSFDGQVALTDQTTGGV